jgi:hypothetical protein
MQYEPLTDYLERLAHANGYNGHELWSVLNQDGESHEKILSNALNGFSLPEFSGPADRHVEIEVNQFGLQPADFTRYPRRWCPHCIKSQPWFRPVWRLKVAAVCAEHCSRLLETCPSCSAWPSVSSILRGICECDARFVDVSVGAARRHTRLARALEASLIGPAVIELESVKITMAAPQLVRLIFYIGRLNEGPNLRRPGQLAKLGEMDVSFSMFDEAAILLDNWPEAFWHCLEIHMDASPDDASVRRVFGAVYQVIYRRLRAPANQFLRDTFESFLLDHWRGELCGRHRLFDSNTIACHPRRGLARVARAHNIGGQTLRRMVNHGWLPAKQFTPSPKRQIITIDENQISTFIPTPADYLDLRSAARYLGIKRSRLRELVGLGAILADALPTWRRRNQWYFRRDLVIGFLAEIRKSATLNLNSQTTVTLNHVLKYWRVTSEELATLLEAMKKNSVLYSVVEPGQLRDLEFDEAELRTWLLGHRQTTTEWVSVTNAAELLGLKEEVVYGLVSKALLAARLIERKGHIIRRISRLSLEKFEREYVSLASLAKRGNESPSAVLRRMTVDAVTGPRIDGGRQYFFRRDEVADLF